MATRGSKIPRFHKEYMEEDEGKWKEILDYLEETYGERPEGDKLNSFGLTLQQWKASRYMYVYGNAKQSIARIRAIKEGGK